MRNRHTTTILSILLLIPCLLCAAEKKEYSVARLKSDPTIDGLFDDAAWQDAVESGRNFLGVGKKGDPPRQTVFRAGFTDKGLYFAVLCEEDDPSRIKANAADMGAMWQEDSIEIFIRPEGEKEYLQIAVNAIGARFNNKYRGASALLDWQAMTFEDEKAWHAEIFVPFETFAALPEKNVAWLFNVTRNVATTDEVTMTSWSKLLTSYHEPEKFGRLIFADGLSADEKRKIEKRLETIRSTDDELTVFTRKQTGLYLKRGKQEELLQMIVGRLVKPVIFPDGKRILYHSGRGSRPGAWLLEIESRKTTRICDGHDAAVSPDGKKIALLRDGRLIERELESEKEEAVHTGDEKNPDEHVVTHPFYAPDGKLAYVIDTPDGGAQIRLVGSDAALATAEFDIPSRPAFSPNGKILAYQDNVHIFAADLGTGEKKQLTFAGGVQSNPHFSKDGKMLTYLQSTEPTDAEYDVYALELSAPEKLYPVLTRIEGNFDWRGNRPDAKKPVIVPPTPTQAKIVTADTVVDGEFAYVVVIDRLAGDLVFTPERLQNGVVLPSAFAVLGVAPGKNKIALVSTSDDDQSVSVVKDGARVVGLALATAGRSALVGEISGAHPWRQATPSVDGKTNALIMKTAGNLIPAYWRILVSGDDSFESVIADCRAAAKIVALPDDFKIATGNSPQAFLYYFDRNEQTPLADRTALDVLREGWGMERLYRFKDIEGIRTCRAAADPTAFKDWRTELLILDWMVRIDRPGSRDSVRNFLGDVVALYAGLADRRAEYMEFSDRLRKICAANDGLADRFRQALADELTKLAAAEFPSVPDMQGEYVKLEKAARTANYLATLKEYKEFKEYCAVAFGRRVENLKAYRRFAAGLRRVAGLELVKNPDLRDVCEEIRKTAGEVLRLRYWMEGEWHGERPLNPDEVEYEKVKGL